jgi:hypothetical protein
MFGSIDTIVKTTKTGIVKDASVSKRGICVEHPIRGNGVEYNKSLHRTASSR